jgi:hypothetical protein
MSDLPPCEEYSKPDGKMPPGNPSDNTSGNAEPSGPKLVYSGGIPSSEEINPPRGEPLPPIEKPPRKFSLDKFKSSAPLQPGVSELLPALPVIRVGDVNDWFMLHPSEPHYWTHELYFVNVPIVGVKKDKLQLIDKNIAVQYLRPKKILKARLALATKPNNVFFWTWVPTRNLDNTWNADCLKACEQAKAVWTQVASRREENSDGYHIMKAPEQDFVPAPKWPTQPLEELLDPTFLGNTIEDANSPALHRLIGMRINSSDTD